MKIEYPAGVHRDWLDRNPLPINLVYTLPNKAPHPLDPVASYLVPTGRRTLVTIMRAFMRRSGVAAPVGFYGADIVVNISGNAAYTVQAYSKDNTIDAFTRDIVTQGCYMSTDDEVELRTIDLSTGGTVDYYLTFLGIEFDA